MGLGAGMTAPDLELSINMICGAVIVEFVSPLGVAVGATISGTMSLLLDIIKSLFDPLMSHAGLVDGGVRLSVLLFEPDMRIVGWVEGEVVAAVCR